MPGAPNVASERSVRSSHPYKGHGVRSHVRRSPAQLIESKILRPAGATGPPSHLHPVPLCDHQLDRLRLCFTRRLGCLDREEMAPEKPVL